MHLLRAGVMRDTVMRDTVMRDTVMRFGGSQLTSQRDAVAAHLRSERRPAENVRTLLEEMPPRDVANVLIERIHLLSTSSRFMSWFVSMVQAACVAGSSNSSRLDSPTASSFAASSGCAVQ